MCEQMIYAVLLKRSEQTEFIYVKRENCKRVSDQLGNRCHNFTSKKKKTQKYIDMKKNQNHEFSLLFRAAHTITANRPNFIH